MKTVLFSPLTLRGVTLPNRVVMSPMCQYVAQDGLANDWHLMHYGARAAGGCGLVIVEATGVVPEGRITPGCLGLWNDAQVEALARVTRFISQQGSVPGIQLAHAGRKASDWLPWNAQPGNPSATEGGWTTVGPSAIPFSEDKLVPHALSVEDIQAVPVAFAEAAKRAIRAGFKVIELHAAHGYLMHQFLSPLSNQRTDQYGGTLENRARLLRETVTAIRAAIPQDTPLIVRISATDWVDNGWSAEETVIVCREIKALGVDLMDVSSGGNLPVAPIPVGPGYQTTLSAKVRAEAGIATSAVGMIIDAMQAEHILRTEQADLVLIGRELLRNPNWALYAANTLRDETPWPAQYARATLGKSPITPAGNYAD